MRPKFSYTHGHERQDNATISHPARLLDDDLPILFEQQRDPVGVQMAAFTAKDPDDWQPIWRTWPRGADPTITNRVILVEGKVAAASPCIAGLASRRSPTGSAAIFGAMASPLPLCALFWPR